MSQIFFALHEYIIIHNISNTFDDETFNLVKVYNWEILQLRFRGSVLLCSALMILIDIY